MLTHPLIRRCLFASVAALMLALLASSPLTQAASAQQPTPAQQEEQEQDQPRRVLPAPDRGADEGEGPFERLILRGATMIDGTGAPPRSPVDIVIEGNKIVDVRSVGAPRLEINEEDRPGDATKEIDAHGMYVMPGLIDLHVHTGGVPKAPEAEYVYKLWLANGITTVRGVPTGSLDWSLSEKARSARNEIVAPHIVSYHRPGTGWEDRRSRRGSSSRTSTSRDLSGSARNTLATTARCTTRANRHCAPASHRALPNRWSSWG